MNPNDVSELQPGESRPGVAPEPASTDRSDYYMGLSIVVILTAVATVIVALILWDHQRDLTATTICAEMPAAEGHQYKLDHVTSIGEVYCKDIIYTNRFLP